MNYVTCQYNDPAAGQLRFDNLLVLQYFNTHATGFPVALTYRLTRGLKSVKQN